MEEETPAERTAIRTCPLCEATCGLRLTLDADDRITRIQGDPDDVFSRGFICPKGASLKELHEDPDRLREPMVKQPDGTFAPASWDEAFRLIDARLRPLVAAHGKHAVGVYLGNPAAHQLGLMLYARVLVKALGTRNLFSASTVDQFPRQMAAAYMYGSGSSVPVPDLDRTDYLLVLGANPLASNGSMMTAPDVRGRLRAIQARGGKIVVLDPRTTRTAKLADEHHFIRPGTDALVLMAIVNVLFDEGLVATGAAGEHLTGSEAIREASAGFSPEAVAGATGIPGDALRRITRELAAAPRAAVYGRLGTTTQAFGTTASWLIDVIAALTGNLDHEGGLMWSTPATGSPNTKGTPGQGRGARFGRYASRVRGLPEIFGELPAVTLAEEMETPGPDQVRALITLAGNPAVSTPNSDRVDAALGGLELMVSLDIYLNETTRHADVILPVPSALERSHYDLLLYPLAVRNVANYSPPVFPRTMPDEWETLLRLIGVATGQGPDADVAAIDEFIARQAIMAEAGPETSVIHGREPEAILAALAPRVGPERLLDLQLRCGPYGEGFGANPEGLSLATLEANPHGVDLGPLQPRLPEVLRTTSGQVELAPEPLLADVARLRDALEDAEGAAMVLIGRRDLRSNNSWMHNLPVLVKGKARCTVLVHPDDASRLGLRDGEPARVSSRAGAVEIPVEVTPDIMPGVVSIPHGWGHDAPGLGLRVASAHPGANINVLTDELRIDPLSGNAALSGVPVELVPVSAPVPA